MSIVKTTFSGETKDEQFEELSAWMTTNASDLFNTVECDSNSQQIWCNKRQDVPMGALTLCPNTTNYAAYLFIPTTYGSGFTVVTMGTNGNPTKFNYGIKTSCGIYLDYSMSNNELPCGIFISKSNIDTTYAVYMYVAGGSSQPVIGCADIEGGEGNTSYPRMIWSSTDAFYAYGKPTSKLAYYTVLTPFVSEMADVYCPYIFDIYFNQFAVQNSSSSQCGILTLNGKDYFTNGRMALADY